MEFIDKKKINKYIVIALLFLSFGFAQLQPSRGMLAYMAYNYPELGQPAWLFNDVFAIIAGGIIPTIVYEIITAFAAKFVAARNGGASDDMKYALRFFYIVANVVIGCVKFIFYVSPLITIWGNILIDFVITTVFFSLYLWYCARRYVPNTRWGSMLLSVGGTYLIAEAIITVFNLIIGVLLV